MAVRLIEDNIVVTAIAPGAFASDMNRDARDHGDEVAEAHPVAPHRHATRTWRARRSTWPRRAGDYVVGETIAVDGGVAYAGPGIEGSGWIV